MTAWQTKRAVSGEDSLELTTTKDAAWQAAGQRVLPPFAGRAKHAPGTQAGATDGSRHGDRLLPQLSASRRRTWLDAGPAGLTGAFAVMLAGLLGGAQAHGIWWRRPTSAQVTGKDCLVDCMADGMDRRPRPIELTNAEHTASQADSKPSKVG